MSTLSESPEWATAAISVTNQLLALARRQGEQTAWAYSVGYVTGFFRLIVSETTGRPCATQHDPVIDKPVGSRWQHGGGPLGFVVHLAKGQQYPVVDPPHVAVWRWPDRSDLFLHAFCDVLSKHGTVPLTVVLPDIPTLRDFARRYNAKKTMTHIQRALLEDLIDFGGAPNARGTVCYARFRPTLVVDADGLEIDGDELTLALEYLDSHYELQLSPWGLLRDPLMRAHLGQRLDEVRARWAAQVRWTPEELGNLQDISDWYGRQMDPYSRRLFQRSTPKTESSQP